MWAVARTSEAAVTGSPIRRALADQSRHIDSLDSWKAIRAWFDSLVEFQLNRRALGGCAIGSLVPQLAETDEQARRVLVDAFERWEAYLREGLRSMQRQGKIDARADPRVLATATMSSIQGGFLLTQVRRDPSQLAIALDAAYAHLRAQAPRGRRRGRHRAER
jgi:TetR/AcrR family transcriptional repressor of nem operon